MCSSSAAEFDTFLETHKLELTKRDDDDDDEDIMVQLDRADQQVNTNDNTIIDDH